jgi:hypothetical protein
MFPDFHLQTWESRLKRLQDIHTRHSTIVDYEYINTQLSSSMLRNFITKPLLIPTPVTHSKHISQHSTMKLFSTAILLALSASLSSAWEFDAGRSRVYQANRDRTCESVGNREKDRYRWEPHRGTDANANCCLYLYPDSQCGRGRELAVERVCRFFDGPSRRPFDSFQVVCHAKDSYDL